MLDLLLTNNPNGFTTRQVQVHSSEGRNASSLNIKYVIGGLERVVTTTEIEGKIRKARNFGAVNLILTIPRPLGTNLRVEHLSDVSR